MKLRFSSLSFILLILGIVLIYVKIPFFDVLGIILLFSGLLTPVIEKALEDCKTAPPLVRRVKKRDPLRDIVYAAMEGRRALSDDPEERKWGRWHLIEMTNERRSPLVRSFCIILFATYFEEYDEEVIKRLEELVRTDPNRSVRLEAQKAIEKLSRLKINS